jgi:hypothetical protein
MVEMKVGGQSSRSVRTIGPDTYQLPLFTSHKYKYRFEIRYPSYQDVLHTISAA